MDTSLPIQQLKDTEATLADDPSEREHLRNVRPADWRNPEPARCYN